FPVRALAMKGEAWIFLEDLVEAARLPRSFFRIGEYQKYVDFVQKTTDPEELDQPVISMDGVRRLHAFKGLYLTQEMMAHCERAAAGVMSGA
ncbi:MAG: hypothetical protein LBJ61_00250, partial [Deltaproteobacteria bacterium]|nr:hypothetical protein [Deltaproteobacteria bacterium]